MHSPRIVRLIAAQTRHRSEVRHLQPHIKVSSFESSYCVNRTRTASAANPGHWPTLRAASSLPLGIHDAVAQCRRCSVFFMSCDTSNRIIALNQGIHETEARPSGRKRILEIPRRLRTFAGVSPASLCAVLQCCPRTPPDQSIKTIS